MERSTAKTKIKSESRRRFLTAAGSSLLLAACATPGGAPPRSGFLSIPGGRLYYETAGQGPAVVMLHGFTFDTRMWDAQFNAIGLSHRVVRYDLRGFGKSSVPPAGQSYSHAEDLRNLLGQLEIDRAHLVGASMGGRIAIDFALAHAPMCRSLALINPVLSGWQWSPEWLASYAPVLRAAQSGDIAAAKAAWLAHPIFKSARANPALYGQLRQMVQDYSGWHFTHSDPARELNPGAQAHLGRIAVPLLTLVGEQDLPDFQRMAELIEASARGTKVTVAGTGHLPAMEAPQRVNERLLGFFGAGA